MAIRLIALLVVQILVDGMLVATSDIRLSRYPRPVRSVSSILRIAMFQQVSGMCGFS
jgi:hypothetical protein